MNIGRQWNDRLRLWAEQFPKHYYKAHAPLSLSYFTTMEQLPYGEAVKRAFVPAPPGMKWGRKWEYLVPHPDRHSPGAGRPATGLYAGRGGGNAGLDQRHGGRLH